MASDQSDSERQRVTRKDRKKLRIPLQSIFAAQFCVWIFVFYLVSLDLDVEHDLTFLHNCHVLHRRFDSHSLIRFALQRHANATRLAMRPNAHSFHTLWMFSRVIRSVPGPWSK